MILHVGRGSVRMSEAASPRLGYYVLRDLEDGLEKALSASALARDVDERFTLGELLERVKRARSEHPMCKTPRRV